jgi:hypothetical protein
MEASLPLLTRAFPPSLRSQPWPDAKTRLQTLTIEPNNPHFDPIHVVDSRFTLPKAHSSYVWLKSKQHDSFISYRVPKIVPAGQVDRGRYGGSPPPQGEGYHFTCWPPVGGSPSPGGGGVTPPILPRYFQEPYQDHHAPSILMTYISHIRLHHIFVWARINRARYWFARLALLRLTSVMSPYANKTLTCRAKLFNFFPRVEAIELHSTTLSGQNFRMAVRQFYAATVKGTHHLCRA